MQLHIAPRILGPRGERLFAGVEPGDFGLEIDRVVASPKVTHVRYTLS